MKKMIRSFITAAFALAMSFITSSALAATDENGLTPKHWYKFDGNNNSVGATGLDRMSGSEYEDALDGKALKGTGGSSYGDNCDFGGNDFTLFCVAKAFQRSDNNAGILFSSGDNACNKGFALTIKGASTIAVRRFGTADGWLQDDIITTTVSTACTAYHAYAIVYRESDNTIKLYVDGVLCGTDSSTPFQDYTQKRYQLNRLYFGDGYGMKDDDGMFCDDLRVYQVELSKAQIIKVTKTFIDIDDPLTSRMFNELKLTGNECVEAGTYGDIVVSAPGYSAMKYAQQTTITATTGSPSGLFAHPSWGYIQPHTIGMWVKVDELPASGDKDIYGFSSDNNNNANNGYKLAVTNDGKLRIGKKGSTGAWNGTAYYTTSTAQITAGKWYYLTVSINRDTSHTSDASPTSIRVYVNGSQVFAQDNAVTADISGTNFSAFYVGAGVAVAGIYGDSSVISEAETIKNWATNEELVAEYLPLASKRVINLNFCSGNNKFNDGDTSSDGLLAGNTPKSSWINLTDANKTGSSISTGWDVAKQQSASFSDISVKWTAGKAIYGGGVSDIVVLKSYIDEDGADGNAVVFTGIPFAEYDVIVYMDNDTSDTIPFHPIKVNDVAYTWSGTQHKTIQGTSTWGHRQRNGVTYGVNALRISGISNQDITIKTSQRNNSVARGAISAIQIVETLSRETVEISEDTDWADVGWTNTPDNMTIVDATFSGNAILTLDDTSTCKVFNAFGNNSADQVIGIKGTEAQVLAFMDKIVLDGSFKGTFEYQFDTTTASFTASDALKTKIREAGDKVRFVFIGEDSNGATMDFNWNGTFNTHIVFEGGTHAFKRSNGGATTAFANNGTAENPTILVKEGTTLDLYGKDFCGWNAAANPNGVVRVNSGATLNLRDYTNGTFFFSARLYLDAGSNTHVYNSGNHLRINGGNVSGKEQIYVPASENGVATITIENNANMYVGAENNPNAGFYVGEGSTLKIVGELKGIDANRELGKRGAGTLEVTGGVNTMHLNIAEGAVSADYSANKTINGVEGAGTFIKTGSAELMLNNKSGGYAVDGTTIQIDGGNIQLRCDVNGVTTHGNNGDAKVKDATFILGANSNAKPITQYGWYDFYGTTTFENATNKTLFDGGKFRAYEGFNLVKRGAGMLTFATSYGAGDHIKDITVEAGTIHFNNLDLIDGTTLALDFSKLDADATPIDGDFKVASNTSYNFPADLEMDEAFTLCTGTLNNAPTEPVEDASVSVDGKIIVGAILTYDGNTVKYTVATKEITIEGGSANIAAIIEKVADESYTGDVLVNLDGGATLTVEQAIPYKHLYLAVEEGGVSVDYTLTSADDFAKIDFTDVVGDVTITTSIKLDVNAKNHNLIYNYNGTEAITPTLTNFLDFTKGGTGTLTGLNFGTAYTGQVTIKDGVVKTTANLNATFGTAPKVVVNYPGVWEIANTGTRDDKGSNCTGVTGTGTIKYSGDNWHTLPLAANLWANTLGFQSECGGQGAILSEPNKTFDLGSMSGSSGFRSDFSTGNRNVRFTQSRNTTWSGIFQSDRVDVVYVAGAQDATEKTLTMTGTFTADNHLNVEATGSVKLTGTWKGNVTVAGEFGGEGSVIDASAIAFNAGAKLRADWGTLTLNRAPTFGATLNVTLPQGATADNYKLIALTDATPAAINCEVTVGSEKYTITQKNDGIYLRSIATVNVTGEQKLSDLASDITGRKLTLNVTGEAVLTIDSAIAPDCIAITGASPLTIKNANNISSAAFGAIDKSAFTAALKYVFTDTTVPTTAPGAGVTYRWEGETALATVPFYNEAVNGTIELACPVTAFSGDNGFLTGNKNLVVFDEGFSIETDERWAVGNEGNTTQNYKQLGGSILLTKTGDASGNEGNNNTPFLMAHWPSSVNYTQLGGSVSMPNGSAAFGWDGTIVYTLGGGDKEASFSAKGLNGSGRDKQDKGKSSFTVSSNGTLSIGDQGVNLNTTKKLVLDGGTYSATASHTVQNGTLEIAAASTINVPENVTLTITSPFSGSGNITKTGLGTLVLNNFANNASRTFIVDAGTLIPNGNTYDNTFVANENGTVKFAVDVSESGEIPSRPIIGSTAGTIAYELTLNGEQIKEGTKFNVLTLPAEMTEDDIAFKVINVDSGNEVDYATELDENRALWVSANVVATTHEFTPTESGDLNWTAGETMFGDKVFKDYDNVNFNASAFTTDVSVGGTKLEAGMVNIGGTYSFTGSPVIATNVTATSANATFANNLVADELNVNGGTFTVEGVTASKVAVDGATLDAQVVGPSMKYVRLSVTATQGNGEKPAVGEFRLYRGSATTGYSRLAWPAGTKISESTGLKATKETDDYPAEVGAGLGNVGGNECQPGTLIDGYYGNVGTPKTYGTGTYNTPAYNKWWPTSQAEGPWVVTIEFPYPVATFSGCNFCLADWSTRNPTAWTIEVSSDGKTWTEVSRVTDATWSGQYAWCVNEETQKPDDVAAEDWPAFLNAGTTPTEVTIGGTSTIVADGNWTAALNVTGALTLKGVAGKNLTLDAASTSSFGEGATLKFDLSDYEVTKAGKQYVIAGPTAGWPDAQHITVIPEGVYEVGVDELGYYVEVQNGSYWIGGTGNWKVGDPESMMWGKTAESTEGLVWLNGVDANFTRNAEVTIAEGVEATGIEIAGEGVNVVLKGALDAIAATPINISGTGATLTIDNAETFAPTAAITESEDAAGKFVKKGEGTLTLSVNNTFTGGATIEAGTLKFGIANGTPIGSFANDTTDWTVNAVVKDGATLDINGKADMTYVIELEEGATFTNGSETDIDVGSRQTKMLKLSGDATIAAPAGMFGLHNGGNNLTKLELGAYTLTKTGTGTFEFVNTAVSGAGTLDVTEGTIWVNTHADGLTISEGTLKMGENTTLKLDKPLTTKNLVFEGATITGNAMLTVGNSLTGSGTIPNLKFADGATLDMTAWDFELTTLAFGDSLKVVGAVGDSITVPQPASIPAITLVDTVGDYKLVYAEGKLTVVHAYIEVVIPEISGTTAKVEGYTISEYGTIMVPYGDGFTVVYTANEGKLFKDGANTAEFTYENVTKDPDIASDFEDDDVTVDAGAKIGSVYYLTFADALREAPSGATITLLADVERTETVELTDKVLTFDLGAKSITFTGCTGFYFNGVDGNVKNGTVVVDDNDVAGLSAIYYEDAGGAVNGVAIIANNAKFGVVTCADGDEFVDKTLACESVSVTGSGALFYCESEKMTLTDCTATQTDLSAYGATYSAALAGGWLGQLTVNSGTYSSSEQNVISTMSSPAKIALEDGDFTGKITVTPISASYEAMGKHEITKTDAIELAAPEGYLWFNGLLTKITEEKPIEGTTLVIASTDNNGVVVSGSGEVRDYGENEATPFTPVQKLTTKEVVIDEGVTKIGARFFKDFKKLNKVKVGKDVASFGEKAFYKCLSLEEIVIENKDSLTSLENAVVYRIALTSDGTPYMIPSIKVAGYTEMLYGKVELTDPEWTPIGALATQNLETLKQAGTYHFFQVRLEEKTEENL